MIYDIWYVLVYLILYTGVLEDRYFYQCGTGNGCDYLIERRYNTDDCNGNISEAKTWNDTIHIIGGCDGWIDFELRSFLPCENDPTNVEFRRYGGVDECTASNPGLSSYGYGSCVNGKPRYPLCGTAQVPVCNYV